MASHADRRSGPFPTAEAARRRLADVDDRLVLGFYRTLPKSKTELTPKEFAALIKKVCPVALSKEACLEVFDYMDVDSSGGVDLWEFIDFLRGGAPPGAQERTTPKGHTFRPSARRGRGGEEDGSGFFGDGFSETDMSTSSSPKARDMQKKDAARERLQYVDEHEVEAFYRQLLAKRKTEINKNDFYELLNKVNPFSMSRDACDEVFEYMDVDGSGGVDCNEFLAFLQRVKCPDKEMWVETARSRVQGMDVVEVTEFFRRLPKHKTTLDRDDFYLLMKRTNPLMLSKDQCDEIFEVMDLDGNGGIDCKEYVNFIKCTQSKTASMEATLKESQEKGKTSNAFKKNTSVGCQEGYHGIRVERHCTNKRLFGLGPCQRSSVDEVVFGRDFDGSADQSSNAEIDVLLNMFQGAAGRKDAIAELLEDVPGNPLRGPDDDKKLCMRPATRIAEQGMDESAGMRTREPRDIKKAWRRLPMQKSSVAEIVFGANPSHLSGHETMFVEQFDRTAGISPRIKKDNSGMTRSDATKPNPKAGISPSKRRFYQASALHASNIAKLDQLDLAEQKQQQAGVLGDLVDHFHGAAGKSDRFGVNVSDGRASKTPHGQPVYAVYR